MIPFKDNNLPSQSMPWGREVQKRIESLEAALRSSEINNAARDNQMANAIKRLDANTVGLSTAVTTNGSLTFTGTQTYKPAVNTASPMILKGLSGQSSSLLLFQDSTATVLSQVTQTGGFITNSYSGFQVDTSNIASLFRSGSSGVLELYSNNDTITAPGSNRGRIYFKNGTISGTLKLVTIAGTAGIETAIIDNIDTTGTNTSLLAVKFINGGTP